MAISTAVPISSVARVLGIKTEFKDLSGGVRLLPQRLAVVGQGSSVSVYDTVKRQVTSALEVANIYGFGSPLHLAVREIFPRSGGGVGNIPVTIYPIIDGTTASSGIIAVVANPTESESYQVDVNGIRSATFVINVGDTYVPVVAAMVEAINSTLEMPVIAVDNGTIDLQLTSKWKGTSANNLIVSVVGSTTAGNTFAVTQLTGGLVNPSVQPALDQFGNVWETMVLNCLETTDSTAMTAFNNFGEGRWGALVRKPLIVFSGTNEASVSAAIVVPESRKTERVNSQLPAPGSINLPFVIAASQLSEIVLVANNNPPHDYGSQDASGLIPGADGLQWTYTQREQAVKAGSSTIEVKDGVVNISDVVTFYHPTGDTEPLYRFVVDIVKIQNILFNIDFEFARPEWDGAPLIPDNQASSNPSAKKPKSAKAVIASIIDSLASEAIISDPDVAKKSIQAGIDSGNSKRLNIAVSVSVSGNTNVKSIDLNLGFLLG